MAEYDIADDPAPRRRLAQAMLASGMDTAPVGHWTQALARIAQGGLGTILSSQLDAEDRAATARLLNAPGLPGVSSARRVSEAEPSAPAATPTGGPAPSGSQSPARMALLDAISGGEAPGYDYKYGGGRFTSYADHPREAVPIRSGPYAGQTSSAAGRYQFLAPTWNAQAQKLGLTDFTPGSQDAAAWDLAATTYKQKTGRDLEGDLASGRTQDVPRALAGVWPSLPGGDQPNQATGGFLARLNKGLQGGTDTMAGDPAGDALAFSGQTSPAATRPAMPAGAMPGAPAGATAQARPGPPDDYSRTTPQIPPEVGRRIQSLIADPRTRAYGLKIYDEYAKPVAPDWKPFGDNALVDAKTGRIMQVDVNKKTNDIRDYEFYREQERGAGRAPLSFNDYLTQIKKAGAPLTQTQIDMKGESSFAQAAAKHQAEQFSDLIKSGTEAKGMVAAVQSLRDLGSRITTGKTAEMTEALGPYAQMLGIDVEHLPDLQAYKAITSKLAPQMRVAGSGATSDFEMRTFLQALPGLGKTPGGNEIIAQTLDSIAEQKIAAAEIGSRALAGEITPREAQKMLRDLPDPLTLWKKTHNVPGALGAPAAAPNLPAETPSGTPASDIMKKYQLEPKSAQ